MTRPPWETSPGPRRGPGQRLRGPGDTSARLQVSRQEVLAGPAARLGGPNRARSPQSQARTPHSSVQGGGQPGRERSAVLTAATVLCTRGETWQKRAEEQQGKGTPSCQSHCLTSGHPKSRVGDTGVKGRPGMWMAPDTAQRSGKGKRGRRSQHLVWVRQSPAPAALGRHGLCQGQAAARTKRQCHSHHGTARLLGWAPAPLPRATAPHVQGARPASPPPGTAPGHGAAWRRSGTKGAGGSCVRGLEAPSLLLKGSRQKQHSCTRSPYLPPRRRALRGLDRVLQLGPGHFLANHATCHGSAALPTLPALAPGALPARPKPCGGSRTSPCPSLPDPDCPLPQLGNSPPPQLQLLTNPSPLFAQSCPPALLLPLSTASPGRG